MSPNKRMQRARDPDKWVLCLGHQRVADARRYTTRQFLLSAVVPFIAVLVVGVARADPGKEADGAFAQLGGLQEAVGQARDDGVFFHADMSGVSNLRSLVGLTRAELVQHLGPGQVCVDDDGGRECLLWSFYWKPFSTSLTGPSPVLVAIFDVMHRCTDIRIANMQ